MTGPAAAGPPRLRMMSSLNLDEHPTHNLGDHMLGFGALALYCALAILLSR